MSSRATARQARNLCLTLSLVAAALFALIASLQTYALTRELWLLRASGYAALTAFFLSLLMTPASHLARLITRRPASDSWRAFRRSLGMTAAWWSLAHAVLALATYLRDSWPALWQWAYLRAGSVAVVLLALLLVTSYPRLVALLRIRLWKPLHRLAYVAAVFVFQHLMLSPFAPRRQTAILFAGLLLFGLLRFLPTARPSAAVDGLNR